MSSMTMIHPTIDIPCTVPAWVSLAPQGDLVQGSTSVLGTVVPTAAGTGMARFRNAGTAAPPRGPAR